MLFKILVIQAQNDLLDDRLSVMRCLGPGLTDEVPDAQTIWAFDVPSPSARERLTKPGAIETLSARFDHAIRDAGYLPTSGRGSQPRFCLAAALHRRGDDGDQGRGKLPPNEHSRLFGRPARPYNATRE